MFRKLMLSNKITLANNKQTYIFEIVNKHTIGLAKRITVNIFVLFKKIR